MEPRRWSEKKIPLSQDWERVGVRVEARCSPRRRATPRTPLAPALSPWGRGEMGPRRWSEKKIPLSQDWERVGVRVEARCPLRRRGTPRTPSPRPSPRGGEGGWRRAVPRAPVECLDAGGGDRRRRSGVTRASRSETLYPAGGAGMERIRGDETDRPLRKSDSFPADGAGLEHVRPRPRITVARRRTGRADPVLRRPRRLPKVALAGADRRAESPAARVSDRQAVPAFPSGGGRRRPEAVPLPRRHVRLFSHRPVQRLVQRLRAAARGHGSELTIRAARRRRSTRTSARPSRRTRRGANSARRIRRLSRPTAARSGMIFWRSCGRISWRCPSRRSISNASNSRPWTSGRTSASS